MNIRVDDRITDPKLRKQLELAKQKTLAQAEYDAFQAELEEYTPLRPMVEDLAQSVKDLQARPATASVTLKQPAAPKKEVPQEKTDTLSATFLAGISLMLRERNIASGTTTNIVNRLAPGEQHETLRNNAVKLYTAWKKSSAENASTTAIGNGIELVGFAQTSIYDPIKATSAASKLIPLGNPIPFDGANSLSVPSRSGGGLTPAWVQENATIPVKGATTGAKYFYRHKLAVITTFTNEILRVRPDLLALAEKWIKDDFASTLDDAIFNPANAGSFGVSPASIFNGATNSASAGISLAAIITDLKTLLAYASTNKFTKPVLVIHSDRLLGISLANVDGKFPFRDEVAQGKLFGIPVVSSPYVPSNIFGIVDADAFLFFEDPVEVDTSNAVTLVMADDNAAAPTMDGTVAGSIKVSDAADTTPASVVTSTFQTNATALRFIAPLSFGLIAADRSAYLTGVAY